MKIQHMGFNQKFLALAFLAAFGSAHADDDELTQLIKPDSTVVSVGAGTVSGDSKDRTVFSQYNGWRKNDASLLLDFNLIRRDEATGFWTRAEGRNIGLDNRELRFSQQKQGDWKYSAEYSELVRHDPRTINTNLLGAGTSTPTVVNLATPGTGSDLNLDLKRKGLTLSAEKWLTSNLLFEASFKNENKDGARLSGIGNYCSNVIGSLINTCAGTTGALLMLPEPINSTTRQFEVRLNYSGDSLTLNGGYYGSFFTNANGSLTPSVSGNWGPFTALEPGPTLGGLLTRPLALPPDNQAHQLYFAGNYAFTPKMRATFKVAYTHATQNEDFGSVGLAGAPAGVGGLGGVMDTTLAQLGFSGRPLAAAPKLSVNANWRYENKKDKTPLAAYSDNGVAPYTPGLATNASRSSEKANGKLEATYQLPDNYRATLGVDYAYVHRNRPVDSATIPAASFTALREETEELGYRAELRRSMSETLNAGISYGQSKRDGDQWLQLVAGYPANAINAPLGTAPMTMMDRQRDKLKLSADWMPTSALSLQFMLEDGTDKYSGPVGKGLHDSGMRSYGVDAVLTLSDAWKLTGYVNRGEQTLHMDHNAGYILALDNVNTSVGVGVVGKPSANFELGADLSYMDDSNRYNQSMATGAAIVDGLPDVTYRVTSLKLFGKYALDKTADIRVDLVHQSAKFNEWTWGNAGVPFAYSDNTTVGMQPNQSVTFLGARYIYKFK